MDTQDVCERVVMSALRFHNMSMSENSSVCLLGKFHNILYIAIKLCYDWRLPNNQIVCRLLNDIFYCEKTFERLFVGAIFGIRVTHFLSGWKSDFDNREENKNALIYYLDHAVKAKLVYKCPFGTINARFIDIPMESYGQMLPLKVAIQHGSPDILLILLRYGASITNDTNNTPTSSLEILLKKLNDYAGDCDEDIIPIIPQNLLICLKYLLRTVLTASIATPIHISEQIGLDRVTVTEQYPNLVKFNLIPPERSGLNPPELCHLCRCCIRKCLDNNSELPHGIKKLQIPQSLRNYLDLLSD